MATVIDELLIEVGADTDLDTEIDGAVRSAEKSLGRLESDAEATGKAIDSAADRAGTAMSGLDGDVDRAGMAFRGLGDDADRAGDRIKGSGDTAGSGFVSGLTGSLGSLGSKLSSSASNALDDLKGEFAVGGAVAGAALVSAAAEAMEREAAGGDTLGFRLGLDPAEAERLGDLAGEIYTSAFGDSFEQVRDAVDAVKSSLSGALGPADEDLRKITEQALNLAQGFEVDVVEAIGIAGFAVEHGLAGDADHAMDLITTALQRMPASMREELFPAIEEYGSFLRNLGFTGEEAFGLLAAASQEGSFGIDKTADALKELTIRATDMSTTSVDAFEAAGLDAEEMAARFLAGGSSAKGALDDLIDGLLAIEDPVERSNAAIGLFGTPLEDLSVTEIPQFLEGLDGMSTSLGDVSGAAEDAGDGLNDNAGAAWTEFKRTAIEGVIQAMEPLLPILQSITSWAQDHPAAFQAITVAVLALAAGFTALAIAAAVATLAAAPWIGVALLVAGVVAALVLVIALLVIHWDTVKEAAGKAWNFIKEKAMQAFNWIKTNWPLILSILAGPIGLAVLAIVKHWDKIKAGFTAVKNWISARIGDIVGFFAGLPGRLARAASGLWDFISDGFKAAINAVIGIWNGLQIPGISIHQSLPGPIPDINIDVGPWSLPNIPTLAEGGIATGPTMAMIGEGRHDEAVIPLPNGIRALGAGAGAGAGITFNQTVQGSIRSDRDLIELVFDELRRRGFGGVR